MRSSRARLARWVLGLLTGTIVSGAARAADSEQVVVVLPFRVHSAKPLDYLGESLANLIRSRLTARGGVRIVEPTAVPDLGTGAVSDTELRKLAAEVGADSIVSGSLTELAGHYSLDVRVTPAAIGLRPQTLVLTAQRDDELLARVNELADRVLEEVVGAEPALIAEVELEGPPELVDRLRPLVQTHEGEPYDPASIRDDLARLRADSEVANARVDTERGTDGVRIRYQIIGSERILAEPSSEQAKGQRVVEVEIRGNRRIEADAIKARIQTAPGSVYSPTQIAKDLSAVHSLGFFSNVRVFRELLPEGLVVIFQVEENPVVRQISISGNDSVAGDDIRDILTLTTGSSLDYPLLYENRARIEGLYRSQGYYLAEVDYQISPLGEASVAIDFEVTENEKLKLREIRFVGNEVFSDRELREGFQTKIWRPWSYATSWFDRSGTYSEPLFLQDLRLVEQKYQEAGYVKVEVDYPDVLPSAEGLVVTVNVSEGPQYHVGAIDVAGDETIDLDTLRKKLKLKEGAVFNRTFLTDDVEALREHYTERGFFLADVTPLSDLSDQKLAVNVIFQVQKGPLYFIREIGISGNIRSVDPVVRREIPLVEGQLYSSRAIQLSRARLNQLGFFEEVELRPEPTNDPQEIDLEVEVVEKPTGQLSFGAGFSSQDSFQVQGSIQETNLFGRGYGLNLTADLSFNSQSFFLNFYDPYFLGSQYSLSATVRNTSIQFEDFKQDETGAALVLGRDLTEDARTRGFARYNLSSRKINQDNNENASAVLLREIIPSGRDTISSLGFSVQGDYRNDRVSPTDGYEFGGSVEFAGLGGFTKYIAAQGRVSYFLPAPWWMPERSTFAFKTAMGYTLPLNKISDFNFDIPTGITAAGGDPQIRSIDEIDTKSELPLTARYFLGGLGQFQLRGYKSRSVGPLRPILYQVPPGAVPGVPADAEVYAPVGFDFSTGACAPEGGFNFQGNGNGKCNDIDAKEFKDFVDLDEADVIGGNKFITASIEYRFPISDTIGLQGLVFLDTGNAFAEGDAIWEIDDWRWGTGFGVQWFSPFGPLGVILGFPLDPLPDIDDSPVFEFAVGGQGF